MRSNVRQGSALLIVVFVVALLAAAVAGMLQIDTEQIQLMQNHLYLTEAANIAEAGIEDAIRCLRQDKSWKEGFSAEPFGDGSYTVEVKQDTITSTGISAKGFATRIEADVSITGSHAPYTVAITAMRLDE